MKESNLIGRDKLTQPDCLQLKEVILLQACTFFSSFRGGDCSWSTQIWRRAWWRNVGELQSKDGNDDERADFGDASEEGLGEKPSRLGVPVKKLNLAPHLHIQPPFCEICLKMTDRVQQYQKLTLFTYVVEVGRRYAETSIKAELQVDGNTAPPSS